MANQSNRAMRPFWMHQAVEYIIGATFISVAIPSSTPVIPIVLGVMVLVNAAVAIGPAGAFRLVHRQVHRLFDVAIMFLILLAAIQPVYEVERSTRALILLLGLVMGFVWWNSDFSARPSRKERREQEAARSTGGGATKQQAAAPSDAENAGRTAGRSAAQTFLAAKRLKKAMVDDRKKSDSD